MSKLVVVDDSSFDSEVLKSSQPVLVEFGASWCGPCKRQLPILEKIATEYDGKIKVVKIDIDDAPEFSNKFGVKSVPTLFVFNGGEKIGSESGLTSESDLKSKLLTKVGF